MIDYNKKLRVRLNAFKKHYDLSNGQLGNLIGCTASALFYFLRGSNGCSYQHGKVIEQLLRGKGGLKP